LTAVSNIENQDVKKYLPVYWVTWRRE